MPDSGVKLDIPIGTCGPTAAGEDGSALRDSDTSGTRETMP